MCADGLCAVVFSREHVREASAGWSSGLVNQRRAIRRLRTLDALTHLYVSAYDGEALQVKRASPFDVLDDVLSDLGGSTPDEAAAESARVAQTLIAAHEVALDALQVHTIADLGPFHIHQVPDNVSLAELSNEVVYRLLGASMTAARANSSSEPPKIVNNLEAAGLVALLAELFGVDADPTETTFERVEAKVSSMLPPTSPFRARVAQAVGLLGAIGYYRDGRRTGGRSAALDGVHAEYGSHCSAFVSLDSRLLKRFRMATTLLGIDTKVVDARDLRSLLDELDHGLSLG